MQITSQLQFILTLFISVIVSSCSKKDWPCNCTVNNVDYTTTIANSTKMNANKECGDYGKQIGSSQGNYSYVFKIK